LLTFFPCIKVCINRNNRRKLKKDLFETKGSLYSYEETINHFDLIDKDITLKHDIIVGNSPNQFSIEYHIINLVNLSNLENLFHFNDLEHK